MFMIKSIFNLFSIRKIQIIVFISTIILASVYFKGSINHLVDYGMKINWLRFNFKMQYLVLAILLMPVNWLCEYGKFVLLADFKHNYKPTILIKSILAGISLSSFTPMKTGDYIGRLLWLERVDWAITLKAIFWGNWMQFLWLVLGGFVGLFFIRDHIGFSEIVLGWGFLYLICCVIIVLIILWFYIRLELFQNLLSRIPKWSKFVGMLNDFAGFENKQKVYKSLVLAGFRYIVYSFQLWLLIKFLDVDVNPILLYFGILLVFFVQTLLPFLTWLGLIGRTGIAIFVLNRIGVGEIESGISSVLLWIINIMVPATIGFVLLLMRFLKNEKDEK